MQVRHWDEVTGESLEAAITEFGAHPEVRSLLLLLGEEDLPGSDRLDAVLQAAPLPIVGGVFPRVLLGERMSARGGVLVGLPAPLQAAIVPQLSGDPASFAAPLDAALAGSEPEGRTVLVFFDATAAHVDAMLGTLFELVGSLGGYLGGGAGSLSFAPMPSVVSNDGLLQDAAVVAVVDLACSVGVAHGWDAVGSPVSVTSAAGRRIASLDHRPAADVYLERVQSHAGTVEFDEFARLAGSYPLGIVQLDGELVVRDPVVRDGDALLCVGEVAEGAFVRLMYGDASSLLAAASHAASKARSGDGAGELALVFDCISRVLYLDERFAEELDRLDFDSPRVGAATIGEVCNPGDRYLELYNKTVVAGVLRSLVPDG